MNTDRRNFLKWMGAAGCTALTGMATPATAEEKSRNPSPDWMGVLVDTTICIGCRKCEWACNTTHHLPVQPLETFEDKSVFAKKRRPTAGAYTVVNRYTGLRKDGNPIDVKVQCFHCNTPACYSSCIVTAYTKQANGAVTYDPSRCMGCRYCMIACPFQIPAYEYNNPLTPRIRKCTFCFERITKPNGAPACVEICPVQCLTFGRREDLIVLARQKIQEHPEVYTDHIYGEHEAGGTSWLYLASVPFDQLGFVKVGTKPVPRLTETIQHGIFRYFIPPLSLYSILGGIMWLTREEEDPPGDCGALPTSTYSPPRIRSIPDKRRPASLAGNNDPAEDVAIQNETATNHHFRAAPVAKKLMTPGVWLLLAMMAAAGVAAYFRFFRGLGAVTNLNNQYPWGIWIGIDVAGGVALAAGGFTTAALAHIFHRERYEPIVRPALLTAMLGYTFVAIGLLFDLGKYYNIWHPIVPRMWSGHSVLFEVGMCVMFYLTVLYIEFMPIVFERFIGRVNFPTIMAWLNEPVDRLLRLLQKMLHRTMSVFIIAGVVLSCLHQSSLGSLLLIAPTKVHPLWWTPILPILFLLSAIAVGYPMVVFESMIASRAFGRRPEIEVLSPLAKIIPIILATYLGFKIGDMAIRGTFRYLNDGSFESTMFLIELVGGVIIPLSLLFMERIRRNPAGLFIASTLIILGVALNRINVFITAYSPPYAERPYFPAIGEITITAGLIACLIFCYRVIVTHFPVLSAHGPYIERN
jgi:Ni/Fe-hydrogenase subunit HybB-like protein/Fe-S-cluster-containing dehydrogenase component